MTKTNCRAKQSREAMPLCQSDATIPTTPLAVAKATMAMALNSMALNGAVSTSSMAAKK
jgi:hypothetical protein